MSIMTDKEYAMKGDVATAADGEGHVTESELLMKEKGDDQKRLPDDGGADETSHANGGPTQPPDSSINSPTIFDPNNDLKSNRVLKTVAFYLVFLALVSSHWLGQYLGHMYQTAELDIRYWH